VRQRPHGCQTLTIPGCMAQCRQQGRTMRRRAQHCQKERTRGRKTTLLRQTTPQSRGCQTDLVHQAQITLNRAGSRQTTHRVARQIASSHQAQSTPRQARQASTHQPQTIRQRRQPTPALDHQPQTTSRQARRRRTTLRRARSRHGQTRLRTSIIYRARSHHVPQSPRPRTFLAS
jgi:hypothetical protein